MKETSFLYIVTFVANAAILVFEIAGARLLAPYLGTSVEVWSGTIAVILGGMAVGYALGGITADRFPTKRALSIVILCAGLAALIAWGVRDIIPALFTSWQGLPLTFAAMYTATLLFAPTVILLAAISPFIAKFLLTTLESSAKTIGNLNAIGTMGSIAGAVLSGAFLIPFFGLSQIFLGIALVLLGLSLLVHARDLVWRGVAVLLIGTLTYGTGTLVHANVVGATLVGDVSTPYNRIWVFESSYKGEPMLALRTDPFGTQCGMKIKEDGSLEDTTSLFSYLHALDAFVEDEFTKDESVRALFLGGCNYSYPRSFLHAFKNAEATVVEIDPGMTEVAKRYFEFVPSDYPALSIVHEDARKFFDTNDETYDLIIMDVFSSSSNTPHHLTTEESFQSLKKRLAPEGLLLMNIISMRTKEPSAFPASLVKTLETVFPYVAIYHIDNYYDSLPQNLIIVASLAHPLQETITNSAYRMKLGRIDLETMYPGMVLTDDYAPVEYMTHTMREHAF